MTKSYKGTYNPYRHSWYVEIDDYFGVEVVDEVPRTQGLWTKEIGTDRYFSETQQKGWEYWRILNGSKLRKGHP